MRSPKVGSVTGSAATAVGSLTVLGALVGWVGASRAYAVGPHTLYEDHLAAVVLVLTATAVLAGMVGRKTRTAADLFAVLAGGLAAYVAVALAVTLAIDEMRRFPDVPRALLAETAGGALLVAFALGAVAGYGIRRAVRKPAES